MKVIILTLCFFIAFINFANAGKIYNCIDREGNIIVTDKLQDGMKCDSTSDDIGSTHVNETLPERSKGISMHMLPKRVANLDTKMKWGVMVFHTKYLKPETEKQILQTTNEFLTYIRKQDREVQENGVWIVITNPAAYSKEELTLLEDIKTLCKKEKIILFVARGSQLPNGWVRY